MRKPISQETVFRHFGIAAITMWFFITYFQGGSRPDETEHCHAAWLIAVQGLAPFTDFFQHHSPMLWDVLGLFYRMGGEGVAVLFWGRLVSLSCVMLITWCLWKSLRLTATADEARIPFCAAVLTFATSNLMMNENFIIRPETISAALFALAWLIARTLRLRNAYSTAETVMGTLAAGALYGWSLYASPRFVLLSPLFLLNERGQSKAATVKSLFIFAIGAVTAVAVYLRIDGLTAHDFYVRVLLFSARLQRIGDPPKLRRFYWNRTFFTAVPLVASLLLCEFYRRHLPEKRVENLYWTGLILLVFFGSIGLSYPHTYPQNFMPLVLILLFGVIEAGRRFSWAGAEATLKPALIVVFAWSMATMATDLRNWFFREHDIFSVYLEKTTLLSHVPPGATVLLPYDRHPIAAPNASFFAGYLESDDTRQKQFVEWAATKVDMPPFDLIADLREKKPALIAPPSLLFVIPNRDLRELKQIRQTWYRHPYASDPRWEYSHIAIRQDFPRQVRVSRLPPLYRHDHRTFP